MKKPFFSLLLALLFSTLNLSSAQAGDAAQLEFIGFSKDGKYMAFEQYGIADGIGAPYSEIHLIDVAKNKYLVRPFKTGPSEMHVIEDPEQSDTALEQVRTLSAKAAQTALKKYGLLEKSRLAGKHLIHHPLYDTGVDPLKVQFALQTPLAGLAFDEYALTLKQKTLKQDCYGFGKAKIFTLRVAPAGTEEQAQVLQEDRILPKSRDCPLSYKIADVYLYKEKSLVVFINMFYPGFEGQDMRYLAVTGTLGSNKKVINKKNEKKVAK
ncbi:DUF2259 domain-containing protein [Candidatus Venteria ishoeyi]|uniref:DUF2259 domain-containing protein n=1 Tax=Candidatus Venteria ishoeyi TaxID=1899563 RepID=UPI0025A4CD2D|nr:DUF2259 domain-containing protein [Candidatus Venteria ishoeyi]MDM8546507.1 DUF2259 domain-containing protein [Candidatus Venteria ishoeyi]